MSRIRLAIAWKSWNLIMKLFTQGKRETRLENKYQVMGEFGEFISFCLGELFFACLPSFPGWEWDGLERIDDKTSRAEFERERTKVEL